MAEIHEKLVLVDKSPYTSQTYQHMVKFTLTGA